MNLINYLFYNYLLFTHGCETLPSESAAFDFKTCRNAA